MESNTYNLIITVLALFIMILTYYTGRRSYKIASERIRTRLYDRNKNQQDIDREKQFTLGKGLIEIVKGKVNDFLSDTKFKYLTYEHIFGYLNKNGQMVEGVKMTTPETYILTKIVSTLIFVLIAIAASHNAFCTLIAFFIGVTYQDIKIYLENKKDNKKMIDDIQHIHERISLQIQSNIYIADTFYDCFFYTVNPRLKRAFLELDSKVKLTHNLDNALKEFEKKFNNPSITLLCKSIQQAGEVGHMTASLDSMKKEARELQKIQNHVYKEDLDRKFGLLALGIFGMICAIILYLLTGEFMADIKSMFTF